MRQHQRSSGKRRLEQVVAAELNRPLTPAEFDDLQEEIIEAMGEEEEVEDETDTAGKQPRLVLVWTNPDLGKDD